jgi:hypothetical protein
MLPLSEIEALALFIKLFNLPDEIGEVSKENKYFRDSEERLAREINARLGARVSEREKKFYYSWPWNRLEITIGIVTIVNKPQSRR